MQVWLESIMAGAALGGSSCRYHRSKRRHACPGQLWACTLQYQGTGIGMLRTEDA